MRFKAILFDLDGTLLNTLRDIGDAVNRLLIRRHFPSHPVEAYRYLVGDGARMLIIRALPPDRQDEALIQACMEDFSMEYEKNWNITTSLYPGVSEMLDLIQSSGLKMAILSNKPHEFTRYCVDEFLSVWRFESVMGHNALIPHKPDPAGAFMIAGQLGVDPKEFLYLGDTGVDMQTASASGMFPVGALWGFRSSDELTANGAKALVNHPVEVAGLIK
jgi:phosphoglycolate phosphatase